MGEGTEVARLRRRFSFVLQQALSFRTRHHLCKQGVVLASTRQLRSQGPVSVQAHRTEGFTGSEGQEGVNGVGGGNGDGNGVGCGNGDVNGHGDGDGAGAGTGTGTGVEVNEGAQDGNRDGSEERGRGGNGDGDSRRALCFDRIPTQSTLLYRLRRCFTVSKNHRIMAMNARSANSGPVP